MDEKMPKEFEGSCLTATPIISKEDDDKLGIHFSRLKYAIDLIEKGRLNNEQLKAVQQFAIDLLITGLELRIEDDSNS